MASKKIKLMMGIAVICAILSGCISTEFILYSNNTHYDFEIWVKLLMLG